MSRFDEAVEQVRNEFRKVYWRFGRNLHDDADQELALVLYGARGYVDDSNYAIMLRYLRRTARNCIVNLMGGFSRNDGPYLAEAPLAVVQRFSDVAPDEVGDSTAAPWKPYSNYTPDRDVAVLLFLESLPMNVATAIRMRMEGYTFEAIGNALGCSDTQAANLIYGAQSHAKEWCFG